MSQSADRERAFFDKKAQEDGHHWWGNLTKAGQLRQDIRARMAMERLDIAPGKAILEVGCADGEFTRRFLRCGANVVASDISPGLIELARRNHISPTVTFEVANVEQLDYPDASFDAVMGNAILHHLRLDKVFPELRRVLKPGGKLFFTEPNMANPQVWLTVKVPAMRQAMGNSPDEIAFWRWDLARVLARHGFQDIDIRPFDFLHPSTPERLIPLVAGLGWMIERTPLLREIAGSLLIVATK